MPLALKKTALAGTLESGDIQVILTPNPGGGIEIELESVVRLQFGDSILASVRRTLADFQVAEARVGLNDRGAIDATITARVRTAICRAADIKYDWSREV